MAFLFDTINFKEDSTMKHVHFVLACTLLGIAVANFTVSLLALLKKD